MRFARNWNSIRVIAFGDFGRRSGGGRRGAFGSRWGIFRRGRIWIKWLLNLRCAGLTFRRISRNTMTNTLRRFVLRAGCQKQSTDQHEQQREFHKVRIRRSYLSSHSMPIAKSQVRGKIDPLRAEGSRLKQSVGSPSSDVETRPQLRWLDIGVPPAPKLRPGAGRATNCLDAELLDLPKGKAGQAFGDKRHGGSCVCHVLGAFRDSPGLFAHV